MKKIYTFIVLMMGMGLVFGQTYHIGDLYTAPDGSQGVVFYENPDGSGGLVVALNNASNGCIWGASSDVMNLDNLYPTYFQQLLDDTAGYSNTQKIRAANAGTTIYAAGVVDFNNGWFLPSPAQLTLLYAMRPFISNALLAAGGTLMSEAYYWSSAEYSTANAWVVDFGDYAISSSGAFYNRAKSSSYPVRAIRSFSNTTLEADPSLSYTWSTTETTPDITVHPTQTTTYTVTVSTPGGCADTVEHTILVGEPSSSEFTIITETPYEWNGITYNQSGDYTQTFVNATGCDSVVTLHLTINTSIDATISASADVICEGEEVTLQVVTAGTPSSIQVPPIVVGDILCTDGTIVKPVDYANSGKTAMGIVFYVDNTGAHGWAVHLHYQHVSIEWTTPASALTDIPTLTNYSTSRTAINDLDGYNNTLNIRNIGNADTYPAAYAVDFENGWYIPAAGQLRQLFNEIVEVRASLQIVGGDNLTLESGLYFGSRHWSSTEADQSNVWDVSDRGSVYRSSKQSSMRLRSIRSF